MSHTFSPSFNFFAFGPIYEVTALADRLLVIHEGKIVGEVDPKLATIEEIGLMMTGGHR